MPKRKKRYVVCVTAYFSSWFRDDHWERHFLLTTDHNNDGSNMVCVRGADHCVRSGDIIIIEKSDCEPYWEILRLEGS